MNIADLNPIGVILDIGNKVIERVWPDPADAAKAKLQLLQMQQDGELKQLQADVQVALAQAATNTAEAQSADAYTSRWRPTVGYVLAAALGYTYVVGPILDGAAALFWPGVQVPKLQLDAHLWELTMGMLGLAGWRTMDKRK